MDHTYSLGFGLLIGIIMIWMGILVLLVSRPLAKGEVKAKEYNYRPWQPKFVRSLTNEESDSINRKAAKWAMAWGASMSALGIVAILFGAFDLGNYVLALLLVPVALMFVMIFGVYAYTFRVSKRKRTGL